jgi:hypothetical protein
MVKWKSRYPYIKVNIRKGFNFITTAFYRGDNTIKKRDTFSITNASSTRSNPIHITKRSVSTSRSEKTDIHIMVVPLYWHIKNPAMTG